MSETSDTIVGTLKQQYLDPVSGLYDWVPRTFKLQIKKGVFESFDPSQQSSQSIEITTAKYAKEWSTSTAIAGCGFDVVWASGKIWSFLAESESNCQLFVTSINECIAYGNNDYNDQYPSLQLPLPLPPKEVSNVLKPPLHPDQNSPKSFIRGDVTNEETQLEIIHSPYYTQQQQQQQQQQHGASNSINTPATINQMLKNKQREPSSSSSSPPQPLYNNTGLNISEIPITDSITTSAENSQGTSPESDDGRARGQPTYSIGNEDMDCIVSPGNNNLADRLREASSNSSSGNGNSSSTSSSNNNKNSNNGAGGYTRGSNNNSDSNSNSNSGWQQDSNHALVDSMNGNTNSEMMALRKRCHELGIRLERERAEADVARELSLRLQHELDARAQAYEQQLRALLEKEKNTVNELRNEALQRIQASTLDSNSIHEAEARALKEQHVREINCLKEEVAAERKRYNDLVRKEIELRNRAEGKEVELHHEVTMLQDQLARINTEYTRLREIARNDASNWEREKLTSTTNYEMKISKLESEKESLLTKTQTELRSKVNEMTIRFEATLKDMEVTVTETVRQQLEGERLRQIAQIQKQCTKEIETARTEERRHGASEVARIKALYSDRERQTGEDLSQLEQIHSTRVKRLQQQVDTLRDKEVKYEKRILELQTELKQNEGSIKKISKTSHIQLVEEIARSNQLSNKLQETYRLLEESKACEQTYRDKLAKVLEEARIQRAELIEVKRQAADGNAQVYSWRNAVKECDASSAATVTALQIAKEEIAMLEHEVNRLRKENNSLLRELSRHEKLVYGVVSPGTPAHNVQSPHNNPFHLQQQQQQQQLQNQYNNRRRGASPSPSRREAKIITHRSPSPTPVPTSQYKIDSYIRSLTPSPSSTHPITPVSTNKVNKTHILSPSPARSKNQSVSGNSNMKFSARNPKYAHVSSSGYGNY